MPDRPGSCSKTSLDPTMLRQRDGGKPSSIPASQETINEVLSSQPPPQLHDLHTVRSVHSWPCIDQNISTFKGFEDDVGIFFENLLFIFLYSHQKE